MIFMEGTASQVGGGNLICLASLVVETAFFVQVVFGILIALLSIHVYSICQPFIEDDDDVLALCAHWVIYFILFGGLLLKVNLNTIDGYDKDGDGFGFFLVVVNVMVLLLGVGSSVFSIWGSEMMSSAIALKEAFMHSKICAAVQPCLQSCAALHESAMTRMHQFMCRPFTNNTPNGPSASSKDDVDHKREWGLSVSDDDGKSMTMNPAFERSASTRCPDQTSEPAAVV